MSLFVSSLLSVLYISSLLFFSSGSDVISVMVSVFSSTLLFVSIVKSSSFSSAKTYIVLEKNKLPIIIIVIVFLRRFVLLSLYIIRIFYIINFSLGLCILAFKVT